MKDTIFALSSGHPPAAIAVVRISGPAAFHAVRALAGKVPLPRRASLRTLRDADGEVLDRGLVLAFPGPATATGEDLGELHLHGGRAVIDGVLATLGKLPTCRAALPGEFTRRALENGRVDLAQAQGLADLLEAETDAARRAALATTDGVLGRTLAAWFDRVSMIGALIEAALDHDDVDDVGPAAVGHAMAAAEVLHVELSQALKRPSVERLRDGALIVLAGPRNAGKSSLFNAMLGRDVSIVTPIAGTTRDLIEAVVVRNGTVYRLVDTAGLVEHTDDEVETIGIERANTMVAHADTVLWLGAPDDAPERSIVVAAKADLPGNMSQAGATVSIYDPESVSALWALVSNRHHFTPIWNDAHFHERQRRALEHVCDDLVSLIRVHDPLIAAEHLRSAQRQLAELLGRDAPEAMLDALFTRFCIGK